MAREKQKKGQAGIAVTFINRTQAVKKLQISLAAFRRLCILKGVYPRDPTNKKKAGKGSTAPKTYYYRKDIQYLLHDPILRKLREQKTHKKKLRKAFLKGDLDFVKRLEQNRPEYRLDHVIKERYPSFIDALRDLDDALAMIFLFATLPCDEKIARSQVRDCQRLASEFMALVMYSRTLRKVFLSVKGVYYQVEICGQEITWICPYQFSQDIPVDVDFKVMSTFLEVYITLLEFVNYKLYLDQKLVYPPRLDEFREANDAGISSYVLQRVDGQEIQQNITAKAQITSVDEEMQEKITEINDRFAKTIESEEFEDEENQVTSLKQLKKVSCTTSEFTRLFQGHVFWLSRETPRWSLEFVLRSFGAQVAWEDDSVFKNRPKVMISENNSGVCGVKVDDPRITHHVVDRPMPADGSVPGWMSHEREYVQPQWVYDCINAKRLLSTKGYRPGEVLPPHLSPFVTYGAEDYAPEEAQVLQETVVESVNAEEKERAMMVMSKKDRKLFEKIQYGKTKKSQAVEALKAKKKKLTNKV